MFYLRSSILCSYFGSCIRLTLAVSSITATLNCFDYSHNLMQQQSRLFCCLLYTSQYINLLATELIYSLDLVVNQQFSESLWNQKETLSVYYRGVFLFEHSSSCNHSTIKVPPAVFWKEVHFPLTYHPRKKVIEICFLSWKDPGIVRCSNTVSLKMRLLSRQSVGNGMLLYTLQSI